jgi:prevent-host-death family protein
MEVPIHDAKAHFLRLLRRVEAGEEIVITRGGKPIARLVPVVSSRAAAQGMDRGRVWIADDFDAPDPELEALFEGTAQKKPTRRKKSQGRPNRSVVLMS